MARNRYDRTDGRDDVSRVGFWTPETPEFLEKRDERRAAQRSSATSYTQAKATIRRISLANQAASDASRRAQGHDAPIIDFSQLDRNRYGYGRDDYRDARPTGHGRNVRFGAEVSWDPSDSGGRTARSVRASFEVSGSRRGSQPQARQGRGGLSCHVPSRLIEEPSHMRSTASVRRGDWDDNAFAYDYDDPAAYDEDPVDTSLRGRLRKARHDARSRRADRAFAREYADAPTPADDGPRAAVYRGKMGRQHQRATRMQSGQSGFSLHMPAFLSGIAQALSLDRFVFRPWFARTALAFVCVALAVCVVYEPAQDYYLQSRANDQMMAEYQALVDRNAELEEHVAALQTDEGIAELAHESLGWVADGEHSVSVLADGSSEPGTATIGDTEAVVAGSVPAPETWYSPVLDAFFGYEG